MGLEPITPGVTIQCLYPLDYYQHMESRVRFELTNMRVAAAPLKPLEYPLIWRTTTQFYRAPSAREEDVYLFPCAILYPTIGFKK